METRKASESRVETSHILLPKHINPHGTAFGGEIMYWIDEIASIAARRHVRGDVVTASIDSMSFKTPIFPGEHVILKANVTYTGRTSLEVAVDVFREQHHGGQLIAANTAYLTFVALDKDKCPTAVPVLIPETDLEKQQFEEATLRVTARKELRNKLKKMEK